MSRDQRAEAGDQRAGSRDQKTRGQRPRPESRGVGGGETGGGEVEAAMMVKSRARCREMLEADVGSRELVRTQIARWESTKSTGRCVVWLSEWAKAWEKEDRRIRGESTGFVLELTASGRAVIEFGMSGLQ